MFAMLKKLSKSIREFKLPSIITLIFIVAEAIIEVFIPFITADMVSKIQKGAEISEIIRIGGVLALMACISLACGGIAGFTCAKASAGFAKNLRHDIFYKIQTYSIMKQIR